MNKHTSGPWKADRGRVKTTDEIVVAIVARFDDCTGRDCPFQQANARLIAAAPDLLAALQALLSGAQRVHVGMRDEETAAAIPAARAAIARATGEGTQPS